MIDARHWILRVAGAADLAVSSTVALTAAAVEFAKVIIVGRAVGAIQERVVDVARARIRREIAAVDQVEVLDALVDAAAHVVALSRVGDVVHRREAHVAVRRRGAAGTRLVKDILPGEDDSNVRNLFALGDLLLFEADDGEHGGELWRSDGTAEGTVLVRDVFPGFTSGVGAAPLVGVTRPLVGYCGATLRFLMSHWPLTRTSWSTPRPAAATRGGFSCPFAPNTVIQYES